MENNFLLFGKIENSKGDVIFLGNHYGKYSTLTNKEGYYRFDLYIKDPDFLLPFGWSMALIGLVYG